MGSRSHLVGLAVLSLVLIAAWVAVDLRERATVTTTTENMPRVEPATESAGSTDQLADVTAPVSVVGRTLPGVTTLSNANAVADLPKVAVQHSVLLDPEMPISEWQSRMQAELPRASPEEVARHRRQADEGDPESAYWMFQFLHYCNSRPKTGQQLDVRLRQIQERMDRWASDADEGRLRGVEYQTEQLESDFALCSGLDPDRDYTLDALEWLETAADLGHMGAQRLYHYQARRLLVGNGRSVLLFRQPELIGEFQLRADSYARALLATDHPEAFLLMARMLFVGDVYHRDLTLGYAYALAVKNEHGPAMQDAAQRRLDWIGRELPPAGIAEAERLARGLLRDR